MASCSWRDFPNHLSGFLVGKFLIITSSRYLCFDWIMRAIFRPEISPILPPIRLVKGSAHAGVCIMTTEKSKKCLFRRENTALIYRFLIIFNCFPTCFSLNIPMVFIFQYNILPLNQKTMILSAVDSRR